MTRPHEVTSELEASTGKLLLGTSGFEFNLKRLRVITRQL